MFLRWHLVASNLIFGLLNGMFFWFVLPHEVRQTHATFLCVGSGGIASALGLVFSWRWQRSLNVLNSQFQKLKIGDYSDFIGQTKGVPTELQTLFGGVNEVRKNVKEQLRVSALEKNRLEDILDNISCGIMVTDIDSNVILANNALCHFFGSGNSSLELQGILTRYKNVEDGIGQVLKIGQKISMELTLPGEGPNLDVQMLPFIEEAEYKGVVSVFYDISEMRRVEAVRKDFVANVSHELRTPLTAIKGCAETLESGALNDPQVACRFVTMIGSHADRLNYLLSNLLNLAQLEAEQLKLQVGTHSLINMVEGSIGAIAALAKEKNIKLKMSVDKEIEVSCDRRLVEQALINLLSNAVKYTANEGKVTVHCVAVAKASDKSAFLDQSLSTRHTEVILPHPDSINGQVLVEIRDTGIGIGSADLGRIFERFYRVDKGRSRAMGGTGLGLSIVRHILELHQSSLYVCSELGHGTTFGFSLTLPEIDV